MVLVYDDRTEHIYFRASLLLISKLSMKPDITLESTTEATWSTCESGIRIGLKINNILSGSMNLSLCFSNSASHKQRIYFLENAFFRSFQSYFWITNSTGELILFTPPSPPHGYVVGLKDFPLLEPNATQCFNETLQLPTVGAESIARLTWVYRNEIRRWQGGQSTFDGLTNHIFDDNDNPDLWTGELQVEVCFVR